MKKVFKSIGAFLKKYRHVFLLMLPFLMMDLGIRFLLRNVGYFNELQIAPTILFTTIYIILFVGISILLKGIWGKIFYGICFGISLVMFITNCVYYSFTGFIFSFNIALMASEGSSYIWDAIKAMSLLWYLYIILVIAVAVLAIKKKDKTEKFHPVAIAGVIVFFVVLKINIPMFYGKAYDFLAWDAWSNPRNIYDNFTDSNKCMHICGFYEYTFKDFYNVFLKGEEEPNPEEIKYLENAYANPTIHNTNEYTGIFEGKNVIFLQLEGMDSWLLTEETTPNLYALQQEGINFTDHYSFYTGGGSTFNSEFAVNTGMLTPFSFVKNAYAFNTNYFPYSLPHVMKEKGYRVNAFHMNTKEYYNRGLNYANWGYDNYYGLRDENSYSDSKYEYDRELILDKKFYERMFKGEEPFVHYIITYTPHMPFSTEYEMGYNLERLFGIEDKLSEEESAKLFVRESDYMVGLLIQALKDNNLYDNTVIVAYADHYIYTFDDKNIQKKHKNTYGNLISNTPFFIWSSDIEAKTIEKTNSQLDILPTMLNMFGIEYVEEHYMGNDIFDDDFSGYVFFTDYSWFDGAHYVQDGLVTYTYIYDKEEIDALSEKINNAILRNDYTLKYDYFKTLSNLTP